MQRGKRSGMIFSFMYRHQRDPKSWAEVEDETKENIKESWAAREVSRMNESEDEAESAAVPACPGAAAASASPAAGSPKSPAEGGASSTQVAKPKALPSKHKAHVESIRQVNEDGVPTGVGLLAGGGVQHQDSRGNHQGYAGQAEVKAAKEERPRRRRGGPIDGEDTEAQSRGKGCTPRFEGT